MSTGLFELQDNAHVPPGSSLWSRLVWDGRLVALMMEAETGWQITLSHYPKQTTRKLKPKKRYPTLPELAHARTELCPDVIFICTVPTDKEARSLEDTSIDLFEFPPRNPLEETKTEKQLESGLYVPK